jgi:hypothetical protein
LVKRPKPTLQNLLKESQVITGKDLNILMLSKLNLFINAYV